LHSRAGHEALKNAGTTLLAALGDLGPRIKGSELLQGTLATLFYRVFPGNKGTEFSTAGWIVHLSMVGEINLNGNEGGGGSVFDGLI
jgi:hypothetical protein